MMALLLYANIVVGEVENVFEDQGTQFGDFQCSLPPDGDMTTKRLCKFIDFCKDWFERCGSEDGADASEFDQFRDIVSSGKWSIRQAAGDCSSIKEAPMFHDGREGQISWLG
jgi:hypothetical protein